MNIQFAECGRVIAVVAHRFNPFCFQVGLVQALYLAVKIADGGQHHGVCAYRLESAVCKLHPIR